MLLHFYKMTGAGNDFVMVDNRDLSLSSVLDRETIEALCDRRFGIGADGLIAVEPSQGKGGIVRMRYYNADGGEAEMCGNGARCIARYGYEKGLAGETQRVETTAGLVVGQRRDKRMYTVRLNDITKFAQDITAKIDGKTVQCDYLELGDPGLPHAVVLLDGDCAMTQEALRELGRKLRANSAFPKGANVNFCRVIGENEVEELTYERGVEDFTLACGTGTGSVVAALMRRGLVSGENTRVHVPGGELFITLNTDPQTQEITDIYLTGPTNIVAEGEVCDEELHVLL